MMLSADDWMMLSTPSSTPGKEYTKSAEAEPQRNVSWQEKSIASLAACTNILDPFKLVSLNSPELYFLLEQQQGVIS